MDTKQNSIPEKIGPYTVIRLIGKGGMGEVFLVKDPVCEREIALKRIKPERQKLKRVHELFLKEARIAGNLSHPSIIPIFSINPTPPDLYYTMPFVQGNTLRRILSITRWQEKSGRPLHPLGRSIPALTNIFLQICQAVAHAHAKGILHRDIKADNIIIGKYGEVIMLDWGLADRIENVGKIKPQSSAPASKAKVGLVGTISYLAPELIYGKAPSVQSDIYALGVILYQMLTLEFPFHRSQNVETLRNQIKTEKHLDPIELAPHREIPQQLAAVAAKCLAPLAERYQTAEQLILDIQKYAEGVPEWILVDNLALTNKEDWRLEENILLAKHIAITKTLDTTTWAALKISRKAFSNNMKIEASLQLNASSQGIGFLLCIPEEEAGKSLEEGYCLWLGSKSNPGYALFRSNIQVLEIKDAYLEPDLTHEIKIEKMEDQLRVFIDGALRMSFVGYLPMHGSLVGFLYKDDFFTLKNLRVFIGSLNVTVNCLAIPNSFLSHGFFDLALQEYRRIGQCFPGRMEGREALFRAGLTLLEKGKKNQDEQYYHLALKEFDKLFKTPGAPLEYLGKSLVYATLSDDEEEAKCLELALRKFPHHPLLPMLHEHIAYRMHESSLNNRNAAYRLILLAIRHIPSISAFPGTNELLDSLQKNWEPLYFLEQESRKSLTVIAIQLNFWLKNVPFLIEMAQSFLTNPAQTETVLGNALFALIELEEVDALKELPLVASVDRAFFSLDQEIPMPWNKRTSRVFVFLIRQALKQNHLASLPSVFERLSKVVLPKDEKVLFDSLEIWFYLLQKEPKKAEAILRRYPASVLTQESSYLHFPFGTWLYVTRGKKTANAHFSAVLDAPNPPTPALPSYFLSGRIDEQKGWGEKAFWWEKKELHRQLDLFYRVIEK